MLVRFIGAISELGAERVNGGKVLIDRVKLESEACCEGKYVLAINAPLKDLLTADVALRYKEL